jgi:hypothetical protein
MILVCSDESKIWEASFDKGVIYEVLFSKIKIIDWLQIIIKVVQSTGPVMGISENPDIFSETKGGGHQKCRF